MAANRIATDLNTLILVKGDERYIFSWIDDEMSALQNTLGRYASDKRLSFTWYDAATVSKRVREMEDKSDD